MDEFGVEASRTGATTTTSNPNPSRKCADTNGRGEPCQAYALEGSAFCFWHDPARVAERQAAQARGGRARHGREIGPTGARGEPVAIERVQALVPLLEREINAVRKLERSIARARCIGYLVGVAIKALEISDLATRIEALEQKVGGGGDARQTAREPSRPA